jgi:hypothetical protein
MKMAYWRYYIENGGVIWPNDGEEAVAGNGGVVMACGRRKISESNGQCGGGNASQP